MHSKINPLPNIGDTLWFSPKSMGPYWPKDRPCVVIGVSELKHEVLVAFGTSKKTNKLYPSEFLISRTDGDEVFDVSGLSHDTKFDVAKSIILPFTTEFFGRAPRKNNVPSPKMGSIHIKYYNAMREAKKNSE